MLSKTGVLKSKLEEKKLEGFLRPVRQCHVCGSASHEVIALIKQKCLPNLLARPPRTSPVLPRLPGKTPVMSLFLELRVQGAHWVLPSLPPRSQMPSQATWAWILSLFSSIAGGSQDNHLRRELFTLLYKRMHNLEVLSNMAKGKISNKTC